MWRKYHIYLHIFPPRLLRRKLRQMFSPLNFPLEGVIWIETVMAAANKCMWFSFAKGSQGLKSERNQAPAGGLEQEQLLSRAHSSAPSSCLSPPSHHKGEGVLSGLCTVLPPSFSHPRALPRTSPPYGWFFFPGTKDSQAWKPELARKGDPRCSTPPPPNVFYLKISSRLQIALTQSSTTERTIEGEGQFMGSPFQLTS